MDQGTRGELARRVFLVSLALVVVGGAVAYGALAERNGLPPVPQVAAVYEAVTALGDNEVTNHPRRHHLQPTRDQGDGVTRGADLDDDALVLMAGFFDEENQIRLVERDGTVVRSWSLDYFEHFPDEGTRRCTRNSPLGVDTHGAHVTPDGAVVFNYEYCGTVKLDQCGEPIWTIDDRTHHSVVPAEDGGHWLLGRNHWRSDEDADRFPPVFTADPDQVIQEDTILRVDADGEVVDEISIPDLLRDNGLEALLTANPDAYLSDTIEGGELVHANKVTELPSELADAYPLFEAGDLAVSLRGRNLVMVVDPDTREVRWHQVGPWLRQHDPQFRPDGRISVFNNNVYGTAYVDGRTDLDTPFATNIMAVDPGTGETEVVFGQRPGQEMLSVIRGKHQLLDDDGLLVTEFDGGRVLQADASGEIVWEYVNSYDEDHVGEITDALLYQPEDLPSEWRACDG